jgi:hypothetical protein
MNASLVQQLSLVSYGNEYIKTGKAEPAYNSNEVFKFCNDISFKTYKEGLLLKKKPVDAGNNPVEWFEFIKQEGCRELKMLYEHSKDQEKYKDFQLASFVGGGGSWFIETIYEKHSDFWYAHWNFEKKENKDQDGWKVVYEAVVRKRKSVNQQFPLAGTKDELEKTLTAIQQFAAAQKLDNWAEWFRKALEVLESKEPNSSYYFPDMIIGKNYSLPALQLLYAAAQSWVFGGMGSWNDIGFGDTETTEHYEKLTGELYEAVLRSIVAGINS